jgi:hypothetical protein
MIITDCVFSQNSDFSPREIYNQLDYKLMNIDSSTFSNIESQLTKENQKHIITREEKDFIKNYPQIFIKKDKCYNIKSIDGKPLGICEIDSTEDIKARKHYEFKGLFCDFALIYVTGYEWWGYISVDLTDRFVLSSKQWIEKTNAIGR